jgi:hypothetical protein
MKVLPVLAASALLVGFASAVSAYPTRVWVPCQYPHGWNSTDAGRAVWGVPNGRDHQCLVDSSRYWRAHRSWWRNEY